MAIKSSLTYFNLENNEQKSCLPKCIVRLIIISQQTLHPTTGTLGRAQSFVPISSPPSDETSKLYSIGARRPRFTAWCRRPRQKAGKIELPFIPNGYKYRKNIHRWRVGRWLIDDFVRLASQQKRASRQSVKWKLLFTCAFSSNLLKFRCAV